MKIEELLDQLDVVKALMIGFLVAGIYYFTAYDNGDAVVSKTKQAESSIAVKVAEEKKLKGVIRQIEEFTIKMNKLGDKFDRVVRYIPEEFNNIEQMQIISNEAKAAGASIESIKDSGFGKKLNYFQEILVDINLKGSYTQIVLFLSYLTKTNRIITLRDMKMSRLTKRQDALDGEAASLAFSGKFVGYRYIDDKGVKK